MSVSFADKIPDLVVAVGASVTQTVDNLIVAGDAAMIGIISPASVQALTSTFEVSVDGTTFVTLQAGATLANIPVPAVSKAATYVELITWPYWRIKMSGNASGTTIVFQACRHWTAGD
jgi:hypothetical protein